MIFIIQYSYVIILNVYYAIFIIQYSFAIILKPCHKDIWKVINALPST